MPVLSISTNCEVNANQAETIRQFSRATAEMLGKPESYVMVMIRHEPLLGFAGTTDPCAYLELKSIGLPGDQTKTFSRILCDLVESALGVPASRTYIEFSDAQRHLFGWNGATF